MFYRLHDRVTLDCSKDEVITKQSYKDSSDINRIMRKYLKTGLAPIPQVQLKYGDFADVPDFQSALNTVLSVQDHFDSLPSDVRKRFKNDPESFLEFVQNPNNKDEAIRLGLINPDPVMDPAPVPVPPVQPSQSDPTPTV